MADHPSTHIIQGHHFPSCDRAQRVTNRSSFRLRQHIPPAHGNGESPDTVDRCKSSNRERSSSLTISAPPSAGVDDHCSNTYYSRMSFRPFSCLSPLLTVIAFSIFPLTMSVAQPTKPPQWRTEVHRAGPLSALFIGNSHLLMPGFAKQVRERIRNQSRQNAKIHIVAKIGTTLTKTRRKKDTKRILRSRNWDVIVLQESTTAFLTPHGRRNFAMTVEWFKRNKLSGSKILLWETWPQGHRHALYHRRGVWGRWFKKPPRNPKQLFAWIATGTQRAAKANAAYVAPIGQCWMRLSPAKRPYAKDHYHASRRGLRFVAGILANSVVTVASDSAAKPNCSTRSRPS